MRDCITMCFDICTINIRVSIRVRGLHPVFFEMLSCVKKYKKNTKNTLKIHPRHSISINKNTREDTCENTEESVPTVAFEPEAAQKQLFEPEAAQKQLEADPPLGWQKDTKNPKSSPKLRTNAKFEPNAAKDPKVKQKWQTELTFKSWK